MTGDEATKKCSKCGTEYPNTSEFFYKNGDSLRPDCKKCLKKKRKEHYEKVGDKIRDRMGRYYESKKEAVQARVSDYRKTRREYYRQLSKRRYELNKDKCKEYAKEWRKNNPLYGRFTNLKLKYGITHKEYDEMLEKQNGVCAICGDPSRKPYGLHVDHNHDTGKIRKLLCGRCNTALGFTRESVKILEAMIAYIKEHNA